MTRKSKEKNRGQTEPIQSGYYSKSNNRVKFQLETDAPLVLSHTIQRQINYFPANLITSRSSGLHQSQASLLQYLHRQQQWIITHWLVRTSLILGAFPPGGRWQWREAPVNSSPCACALSQRRVNHVLLLLHFDVYFFSVTPQATELFRPPTLTYRLISTFCSDAFTFSIHTAGAILGWCVVNLVAVMWR